MSNTNYNPGVGGLPFGNSNANPLGSNYGAESMYNPTETRLLQEEMMRAIYDNAPQQFSSLKLLFSLGITDVSSDEFNYMEHSFGRSPITAATTAAAIAAVPGAFQTQTFTINAASVNRITRDMIVIYPDSTKGIVVAVTGNTVTVNSFTNNGLSAVAIGDRFAVMSTVRADGMDSFSNFQRLETIEKYGYIQFFLRAKRWGEIELQKFQNMQTTDYLTVDKEQKVKQLRIDMFNSLWNGFQGEATISGGYRAKTMGGIVPTMINAGAAQISTTTSGFKSSFESVAFATNHKVEGGTRMIYGTDESLYTFSKAFKQPTLDYTPNDDIAKLGLKKVELGTGNYVLVPCELWREPSCFESVWAKRLVCIDQSSLTPVKMRGISAIDMGETPGMSIREGFKDWYVRSQLGLKFNNPLGGFIMDIQ